MMIVERGVKTNKSKHFETRFFLGKATIKILPSSLHYFTRFHPSPLLTHYVVPHHIIQNGELSWILVL